MRPPRPPKPDAALWWACGKCSAIFAEWAPAQRHSNETRHANVRMVWATEAAS